MGSRKHIKIKNTGILFELLLRQVSVEILSGKPDKTKRIIQEFFNSKTELFKELELYQTLARDKFNDKEKAEHLIQIVINERKKLNNEKLKKEKYELVKVLKENFGDVESFFKTRIHDYKIHAAIFKLFEHSLGKNVRPVDVVTSKFTLLEHVTSKPTEEKTVRSQIQEEYTKLDKDLRLLAYKILIQRFNEKYAGLNNNQKKLLSEYINHISNSTSLKDFVNAEIPAIKKSLKKLMERIDDDIVKIKVNEIHNQLENFTRGSVITDDQILLIMNYYQLIDELEKATKEN